METPIELKDVLKGFPEFPFAGEIEVPCFEYNSILISEGMQVEWNSNGEILTIESIRLNPTVRFWVGTEWVIARNCKIIAKL